jgi:phage baseplate assembly protein W
MAYVIGRKVVKDTEEFDSYAYGITLPVQNSSTGYFSQAFTSREQAKSNLVNLLLTERGERVMQPDFGTGLKSLLFEQMDDEQFEVRITNTIVDSVSYWLPYIRIEGIEIEATDELRDKNQVNVYLQFSIGSDIQLEEITFTVQG